jgi:glycosyltransferase involved in cell wall biosynthesis
LGQAGNVDRLISNAKGDLVCLLHDDDLLEPSALERLSAPFADPCVVASFGKQIVVGHAGDERIEETQKLNFQCRRTSAHSGLQKDSLISAITGQFPNDGFLVRRAAAQQINYQSLETVFGHGCDYGFGISLALNHPVDAFYFVDEFTAKYRESKTSISRNNSSGSDSAFHCFRYVVDHMAGHHQNPEVHSYLCRQSAGAIAQAARLGYSKLALRWFFSPWHVSRMFSPGGVRRLCLIGVSFCKRRKT